MSEREEILELFKRVCTCKYDASKSGFSAWERVEKDGTTTTYKNYKWTRLDITTVENGIFMVKETNVKKFVNSSEFQRLRKIERDEMLEELEINEQPLKKQGRKKL